MNMGVGSQEILVHQTINSTVKAMPTFDPEHRFQLVGIINNRPGIMKFMSLDGFTYLKIGILIFYIKRCISMSLRLFSKTKEMGSTPTMG